MKHVRFKPAILLAIAAVTVSGCSSAPMRITNLETQVPDGYEALPIAKTSSYHFTLFDIIPIGHTSRERKARAALLKETGADDIINPEISSGFVWTPIGNFERITLQGTPIRKKSNAPALLTVK